MAQAATSFATNWLNRWYLKLDRVHAASIKGSPWLKRVRFENGGGEAVSKRFVLYGHRGASGDLATAQGISANQKNSRKLQWLVPFGTYEGSIRVPHRDIALSRKDKDAAARALQFDTDLALKQQGAFLVRTWFANPGLALVGAVRLFTPATGVISGLTAQEASNFIPGDQLQISLNDGSSASHVIVPGSGIGYIKSRDLKAGTVTVSPLPGDGAAAGAPANWTGTSFFYFRQGEFFPGTNDIMTPLQAYLPQAVATSTLNGVDRSIDSILSGFCPADGSLTGKSIAARVKRTVNEHREQLGYLNEDSEIDCCYMNPTDWGKMEEELHTQLQRTPDTTQSDGYTALTIETANGPLMCISEPQVPRGRLMILSQNDIAWHTPNGAVCEMVDQDGSIVSRMANSNDLELRPVSYIATVMGAPFKHCHISATV
jgi:hypothetical protein